MSASTGASTPDLSALPLSLSFRKAQALYNDIEGTSLSGNDPKLQERITQALALCEAALWTSGFVQPLVAPARSEQVHAAWCGSTWSVCRSATLFSYRKV